jgi:hypothetical protein
MNSIVGLGIAPGSAVFKVTPVWIRVVDPGAVCTGQIPERFVPERFAP